MSDNTTRAATAGGDTYRSKDRAGVKTQVVLLDIGGTTAERLAGSTQKDAGDWALWMESRPNVVRLTATSSGLTTASTAYTADDQLGAQISWANAVRSTGITGTIIGATLLDKAAIVGAVDLYLFDQTATPAADNAQADFSDGDMANAQPILTFPPPIKAKASPSNALSVVSGIALPFECAATTLFGSMVTRTGHTFFGAVGDLVVNLFVQRD